MDSAGGLPDDAPSLGLSGNFREAHMQLWIFSPRAAGRTLSTLALSIAALAMISGAQAIEAVSIGNFNNPVHVAVAPGEPRLLFVVERPGRIRVLRDHVTLNRPFLDIANIVLGLPDAAAGSEEGLLSVAFAPNYAESGRFYVFFTNRDGNVEIDEFRRLAGSSTQADRTTRRRVLVIPHPTAANHNGGQLAFGPDGFLYISVGDGGGGQPPGEPAHQLDNLLGKILRIDPRRDGNRPFRIPNDNPFVGEPGLDAIFAYGLRNPWRLSFDGPRVTLGDVGQDNWEEVNILSIGDASGANFGWPEYEGDQVFDPTRPGPDAPTFPIFTYGHSGGRCAIIGGFVVRGPHLPSLTGRYIYGDSCTGQVRSFLPNVATQEATDDGPIGIAALPGLTSFGRGVRGRIYLAQTSGSGGEVFRLDP
jgi:glucose/arabinose dehydrogenase